MWKYCAILILYFFSSGCERKISTSVEAEKPPVNGKLFIDSKPSGAKIYINNKIQGINTPDSVFWLPESSVVVKLKLPLYRDTSFNMLPSIDTVSSIYVDYMKNPKMYGRIRCETNPEQAEIFLNGINTGRLTPDTLNNLIPGYYNVQYKKDGFRSVTFNYLVTSDETIGNYYSLEDTTIWVSFAPKNSPLPEERISAVENDLNNHIWLASDNYGLIEYDRKNWRVFSADDHFVLGYATYSLAVDSTNIIWIGSSQGLLRYDRASFTYYNTGNSPLPGDQVYHLTVDKFNKLWVSTYGGIAVIDEGNWSVFSTSDSSLPANYVNSVYTSEDETVWAALYRNFTARKSDGVFNQVLPNWEENQSSIFLGSTVKTISSESNGDIWVGFYPEYRPGGGIGGLALIRDTLWYKDFAPQISREINEIFITEDDTKYIVTSGGLSIFNNWADRVNYTTGNSGLYSDVINDICFDNDGVIWLATDGGLTKYKINRLK